MISSPSSQVIYIKIGGATLAGIFICVPSFALIVRGEPSDDHLSLCCLMAADHYRPILGHLAASLAIALTGVWPAH
jgi:hypothetical protein